MIWGEWVSMPNKSANVGPGGKNQLQQNSRAPGSGRIADRGRMIILVGRPTRNLERTLVDTRSGVDGRMALDFRRLFVDLEGDVCSEWEG